MSDHARRKKVGGTIRGRESTVEKKKRILYNVVGEIQYGDYAKCKMRGRYFEMAFFDKVGATLTSFGNDVSNKTKSMVEVNNLNGQLKNCEDSLREYYRQIGKAYYEKTKDTPEEDMVAYFAKVKEAEEAIDHLEASIRRAKGTKKCQQCNTEVAVDTVFCPSCGSKIDDSAACNTTEEVVIGGKCAKCGTPMKVGAAFCVNCGTKVEQ